MSSIAERIEEARAAGFSLVEFDPDRPLVDLAIKIGTPIVYGRHQSASTILYPKKAPNARPNSISAIVGLSAFPFHTDGAFFRDPPEFLLMRSVGKPSNAATLIVQIVKNANATELELLRSDLWKVCTRQAAFFTSSVAGEENLVLRFDQCCMKSACRQSLQSTRTVHSIISKGSITRITWDDPVQIIFVVPAVVVRFDSEVFDRINGLCSFELTSQSNPVQILMTANFQ